MAEEVKVLNSIYRCNFAPGKQGVYFLDGNQLAVDLKLLDAARYLKARSDHFPAMEVDEKKMIPIQPPIAHPKN